MDVVTNLENARKTAGFITSSVPFAERRIVDMKQVRQLDSEKVFPFVAYIPDRLSANPALIIQLHGADERGNGYSTLDKVLIYGKLKSYNGTPEVDANNYIISILEDVSSGIEEIGVDANAPVEYYNLQGVKVANPENGIFIKKQGNKTTKVVL